MPDFAWIDLLARNIALLYVTAILLGLIIGSFLNVVILRLPRIMADEWARDCAELTADGTTADVGHATGESPPEAALPRLSLSSPPSTCPHCGHRIRAHENIPILSYLLLRGSCSACGASISPRYPFVEGFTALLTVVVVVQFGLSWQTPAALLLTWSLIALAIIDYDTQLLPDSITLPLVWLGLILSLFGLFADSASAIVGAVTGYLSLWSVFQLFRLTTGKEGMGYGDFKLLALFGAWLGWQFLPQIILLSALTGTLLGLLMIAAGRHRQGTPIPFGPFLAAAGWISLMWGEPINRAYLQIAGLS